MYASLSLSSKKPRVSFIWRIPNIVETDHEFKLSQIVSHIEANIHATFESNTKYIMEKKFGSHVSFKEKDYDKMHDIVNGRSIVVHLCLFL